MLNIKSMDGVKVVRRPVTGTTIVLHLPFPPSLNNLFDNVPRLGRVSTSEYKAWKKAAEVELLMQLPRIATGPVEIEMTFQEKPGRRDIDNLPKAVLDLLVAQGVIGGDHNKIVRRLIAQWGDVAGVEVVIRPVTAPAASQVRSAA